MNCPVCQSRKSTVAKTIGLKSTNIRIRVCLECYKTYKTKEDYLIEFDKFDELTQKKESLNTDLSSNVLKKD